MYNLDIYQAMWAMEDLPDKEKPYDLEERVALIVEHGFAGALNFIDDTDEASIEKTQHMSELILAGDLKLGLSCNGYDMGDIGWKIDYAEEVGAVFLNIMVKNYFLNDEEAIALIKEAISYGKTKGVEVLIETHRATVTQDLKRAVAYTNTIDEMLLTVDLSHYFVGGEITEENLDLYDGPLAEHFDILLQRTASLHIRVSNGEQVQVSLDRIGDSHRKAFENWWRKGLTYAAQRLNEGVRIPVIIELGPEDYHQKTLVDGQWVYEGDRWSDTLRWKEIIENL